MITSGGGVSKNGEVSWRRQLIRRSRGVPGEVWTPTSPSFEIDGATMMNGGASFSSNQAYIKELQQSLTSLY